MPTLHRHSLPLDYREGMNVTVPEHAEFKGGREGNEDRGQAGRGEPVKQEGSCQYGLRIPVEGKERRFDVVWGPRPDGSEGIYPI